jgi:two-component system sensor histidine kinase SenX3
MTTLVAALGAAAVAAVITAIVVRSLMARRLDEHERRLAASKVEAVEREHRALLDELQAALDSLPLGLVVVDGEERVVVRNRSAERFLGVRHADALVKEALRVNLRTALTGQESAETLELHGPPRRSILVRALPVTGAAIAVGLIEDVSERSRLEAMRTDFVANVSHELRTPVGALALLAETMVDEDDPELLRRLASKMVVESARVASLMEDLLELSRLEHDSRPELEAVPAGFAALEAVDRVRPLAEQRNIRITVEQPVCRLTVLGDRRQLVSALANLLENGVKYSDPGSSVEVSGCADGEWVELWVTDHGIGIPALDQDRIFERFYRVDRARSRDTGGTGLGLAIVRHVATNLGGTVSVESVEGEGSTFTMRLPAGEP